MDAETRFRKDLADKLGLKLRSRREQASVLEWLRNRKIVNEVGEEIEFDSGSSHPFLRDIFMDLSPKQVCMKGSQIGFTTTAILKTIWLAETRNMRIIYTLPTVDDIQEFNKAKILKILNLNPSLMDSMGEGKNLVNSTEQKQFGNGVIHYKGTYVERASIQTTSDLNVHDELDRSKMQIVEQYESRLQASRYKWQWFFSNPKLPDIGVDFFWKQSDQKYWFIKCPRCDYYQYIDWFGVDYDNVDKDNLVYVCHNCRGEISDQTRRDGFWVAKDRSKAVSGYWIPQTIAPWMSCADVKWLESNKDPEYFYNFCLGLPYRGADRVVTAAMVYERLVPTTAAAYDNVSMGVDQGGTEAQPVLHAVIGNEYHIWGMNVFHSWEELERYIKSNSVALVIVDGNPKPEPVKTLRKSNRNKVWASFYRDDPKGLELSRWKPKEGHVLIARDKSIDNLIDQFAEGSFSIAVEKSDPRIDEYIKHWETMYLASETDKFGNEVKRWKSTTGADHFVHATLYQRVAAEKQRIYRKKPPVERGTLLERQIKAKGIRQLEDL